MNPAQQYAVREDGVEHLVRHLRLQAVIVGAQLQAERVVTAGIRNLRGLFPPDNIALANLPAMALGIRKHVTGTYPVQAHRDIADARWQRPSPKTYD